MVCYLLGHESILRGCRKIETGPKVFHPASSRSTETTGTGTGEKYLRSLVIVSGFSSNHFLEAQDMIGSVHHFLPDTIIIIYDLGLNDDQRSELKTFENVEIKKPGLCSVLSPLPL